MDVVANYTADEEAGGAFFSHESDKGKAPADDMTALAEGPKRTTTRRRKHDRTNVRPSTTISLLRSSTRSLEAPQKGRSSTRC